MGVNFSYLLYFNRDQLWNVIQELVRMAEKHYPPTIIHFSDYDLEIPLEATSLSVKDYQFDEPVFDFATSLKFEEDDAILEFTHYRDYEEERRSPPDKDGIRKIVVGYIYLSIYQKIPDQPPSDLVLFDFGTTGTKMSMLFYESISIRKAFIELLENVQGVCGVFNREENGDVFWFKGKHHNYEIEDAYLDPREIEKLIA